MEQPRQPGRAVHFTRIGRPLLPCRYGLRHDQHRPAAAERRRERRRLPVERRLVSRHHRQQLRERQALRGDQRQRRALSRAPAGEGEQQASEAQPDDPDHRVGRRGRLGARRRERRGEPRRPRRAAEPEQQRASRDRTAGGEQRAPGAARAEQPVEAQPGRHRGADGEPEEQLLRIAEDAAGERAQHPRQLAPEPGAEEPRRGEPRPGPGAPDPGERGGQPDHPDVEGEDVGHERRHPLRPGAEAAEVARPAPGERQDELEQPCRVEVLSADDARIDALERAHAPGQHAQRRDQLGRGDQRPEAAHHQRTQQAPPEPVPGDAGQRHRRHHQRRGHRLAAEQHQAAGDAAEQQAAAAAADDPPQDEGRPGDDREQVVERPGRQQVARAGVGRAGEERALAAGAERRGELTHGREGDQAVEDEVEVEGPLERQDQIGQVAGIEGERVRVAGEGLAERPGRIDHRHFAGGERRRAEGLERAVGDQRVAQHQPLGAGEQRQREQRVERGQQQRREAEAARASGTAGAAE